MVLYMSVLERDTLETKFEQDFGAIRTLKIKQRKKRNLDKNLSTKKYEPNPDFGNETRKR